MELKLANHITPFTGVNELLVGKANGVQGALNLGLPELDELEKFGIVRGKVVLLPNKGIEHTPVIGHPVVQLGGQETIAFEHQGDFRLVCCHGGILQNG